MAKNVSTSSKAGENISLMFHVACLNRGVLLAKPVFDYGYDVIVHNLKTDEMWRVQVKTAGRLKGGKYWVGSTHRPRGTRYPPGFIQRFVFGRPDRTGFWIIDGRRLEERAGRGMRAEDWERWELFGVEEAVRDNADPTAILQIPNQRYVTLRDAALLKHVTRQGIWDAIHHGRLPGHQRQRF